MPTFEEMSFCFEDFSGTVRVFPLPNLVLFPHVMQPLHVFEPRYRELLEDAISDDHLIAMAVLRPGWESNYEGRPSIYPVACLGRIASCHELADGTFNILMMGLQRVRLLGELNSDTQFRTAVAELCEDNCPVEEAIAEVNLHNDLRKAFLRLVPSMPEAHDHLDQLLGGDTPLGVLTDLIGYMLDIDISQKEALLAEEDIHRRAKLLIEHLSAAATDHQPISGNIYPPQFSMN
jgi:Lon protease-like protein